MDSEAITSLQELGLSLYEARLYVGLLIHGAQNGNELSRTAGVPSSKVYSTLDKLVAAGIVQNSRRGSSAEYTCVPPDRLLRSLRTKYVRPLEYLETELPTLAGSHTATDILRVLGEKTILQQACSLIDGAESELFVSLWDENVDALRAALETASDRGVRVSTMIYGDSELNVGLCLSHSYRETVATRIGGHMLTVAADGRAALIAHIPKRGEASGLVTENPVLCLVAEEYLRHDVILQRAKALTGYDEWDRWLQADEEARSVILGRTGHESPIEPRAKSSKRQATPVDDITP